MSVPMAVASVATSVGVWGKMRSERHVIATSTPTSDDTQRVPSNHSTTESPMAATTSAVSSSAVVASAAASVYVRGMR